MAAAANALLAAVASNAFTADASVDVVTVAGDRVTVATVSTSPTEVVGVDEAVVSDLVAALTVAECIESDPVLAGDVVCSVSDAGVAGGVLGCVGAGASPETIGSLDWGCVSTPLVLVGGWALAVCGAVDAADSVALVCAPPLLLIVTPDPTWVVDDVAPAVVAVPVVEVVPVPVDVDPVLVDVEATPVVAVGEVAVPVVDVAADPVDDVLVDVEPAALVEDDSEDVPVVSAAANP